MIKALVRTLFAGATLAALTSTAFAQSEIVRDAEFYILEEQNRDKWAAEDQAIDATLAQFRERNGGNPPNILYILLDDVGFGDMGNPTMNELCPKVGDGVIRRRFDVA